MKDEKLKAIVEEAIVLDRDIQDKEAKLKDLKKIIKAEAEGREDEQKETETGSTVWSFSVTDGAVRVNWPAPKLKSTIDGEGKDIGTLKELAGTHWTKLFSPTIVYTLVADFRSEAKTLLGTGAKKLIKLCESKSSPSVAFETKESPQP